MRSALALLDLPGTHFPAPLFTWHLLRPPGRSLCRELANAFSDRRAFRSLLEEEFSSVFQRDRPARIVLDWAVPNRSAATIRLGGVGTYLGQSALYSSTIEYINVIHRLTIRVSGHAGA
jgi:hypothetical protein